MTYYNLTDYQFDLLEQAFTLFEPGDARSKKACDKLRGLGLMNNGPWHNQYTTTLEGKDIINAKKKKDRARRRFVRRTGGL